MITISQLSKVFSSPEWEKIEIFNQLDLSIPAWEFVSIMWPSWRGKTTLLNMISWLDTDYTGNISLFWQSYKDFSPSQITSFRGKNISYIFQDFNLIENLTVEENIDLILDINKTKRRFTTSEILEKVWLLSKKNQYPFLLSGGEKQRVAIARAFVSETKILLADEPTWSLDLKNSHNVMSLLVDLWKNSWVTIIMITHAKEIALYSSIQYELIDFKLKKI
jgi:putative ABC transport system ATP-binding protein